MIDKNNNESHLFELVAKDIKKKILDGYFSPDLKLPNFVELSKMYDVSMATIKKTMLLLNDEKIVVSRVGKGTFINKEKLKLYIKQSKPTNKILFSIINSNDANFFKNRKRLESLVEKLGKELIVEIHDDVNSQEQALANLIDSSSVDGVIIGSARKSLYGVKLYKKLAEQIPTIFCHDIYDSEIPVVTIDNYKTGCLAAKHLLRFSKKKIGVVLDENGYKSDDLKLKGFLDTLDQSNSRSRCIVVRNSFRSKGSTFDDGYNFGSILDLKSSEIDAVFASNDEVARGFCIALADKGFNNLDTFTLLGFGDLKSNKRQKYNFATIGVEAKYLLQAFESFIQKTCNRLSSDTLLQDVNLEPKLITRN